MDQKSQLKIHYQIYKLTNYNIIWLIPDLFVATSLLKSMETFLPNLSKVFKIGNLLQFSCTLLIFVDLDSILHYFFYNFHMHMISILCGKLKHKIVKFLYIRFNFGRGREGGKGVKELGLGFVQFVLTSQHWS